VTDIVFFGHSGKHIGNELVLIANDMDFMVNVILSQYLIPLIAAIAAIAGIFWATFRLVSRWYQKPEFRLVRDSSAIALLAVFLAATIVSNIHGKPISAIDAFNTGNIEYGNLALNGLFTSYQASRASTPVEHDLVPAEEALNETKASFVMPDETRPEADTFPLMRMRRDFAAKGKGYNVIVLIMEGWSTKFIDSISSGNYGVTPRTDRLASESLVFTNFHANEQRSIFGITAVLTGIPTVPGLPYLGKGLELTNITRVGSEIRSRGYKTIFVQTSKRRSYRMDNVATALGFDEFYGWEDLPPVKDYVLEEKPLFGYDHVGLRFLANRLKQSNGKPFFAVFFSGSTHYPYPLFDKKFEKYPHDPAGLNGYLNTLAYSDSSVGDFLDSIASQFSRGSVKELFSIPLIIHNPALFKPARIDVMGSHLDLVPTFYDMLEIDAPYSAAGTSLFRPNPTRAVYFSSGENIGLITKDGYLRHTLKRRLDEGAYTAGFDADAVEQRLLSFDRAFHDLISANRWFGRQNNHQAGQQ
jgi:phosphoglycerol transferase MdoB-like AlkP superfamily enzyme